MEHAPGARGICANSGARTRQHTPVPRHIPGSKILYSRVPDRSTISLVFGTLALTVAKRLDHCRTLADPEADDLVFRLSHQRPANSTPPRLTTYTL